MAIFSANEIRTFDNISRIFISYHLADFFEFLLASEPQPGDWGPEVSKNSKKSAKGNEKNI